ncbi:MAG: hypothetical protein GY910_27505 [bacterium]|nr:hypothetical protein [Deltaproteobacteria bacterium]MCP4908739.1 hypothetical protein [bacterium]
MLRASIEAGGGEVDLSGVADASTVASSPVRGAAALVGFVDATLGGEGSEIAGARDRVREELGGEATIDAAAIIGNFERMVRIADGTGIPLDAAVNVATESIRADLGIDLFESAGNTATVRGWQRVVGRAIDPLLKWGLRWSGRRSKRSGGASLPNA